MQIIDGRVIADLSRQARESERGRTNHNLHPVLADPVQRFLNALEPGSYVAPHRHPGAQRWELFVLLAGAAAVLGFDDDGRVAERIELAADAALAVEVPPGVWHTVLSSAPGTVLLEVKPGPYRPLEDKDFASWAPREGGPGWERLRGWLAGARRGDRPPG